MAKRKVVDFPSSNSEPTWDREYKQVDVIEALNWYNINKTEKDAAKYLGITDISVAKQFTSLAWSLRMQSRGCKFSPQSAETIAGMYTMLKDRLKSFLVPVDSAQTAAVISIQDRVIAKTDEYIGELEGMVDEFGIRGDCTKMDAYQWMVDNTIKSVHANKIAEHFQAAFSTLEKSVKDETLKEYYQGMDKKRMLNLFKCYGKIVADAQKIASNASVARKPRKKKPVSFDKLVKGLKFLPREDTLKLQSVDPVKIIGASQLWVYNIKSRKLGVYNAMDEAGLSVKGSGILNYSYSSSISKTLRKPEKTLTIVTDGGKIVLRKVLDSINSKPSNLNGRINKDTILLRIV